MRLLILVHRYLGLFLGLVIMLWCLSGFVMMYVQYPEYSQAEQLADLEPLDLKNCCVVPDAASEYGPVRAIWIDSFLGRPVLRTSGRPDVLPTDLETGQAIDAIDATLAKRIAERHTDNPVESRGQIERDQWTVAGGYNGHRPLHHFAVRDDSGTELYVSGVTGEIVLATTRLERFWNWLGPVIHWTYPTQLRRHLEAWSQAVIWLSIAGTFLTVTGLYVGIARLRSGKRSPYQGWFLWHHYLGLVFGLFTLTWLVSGLLSMTPFGTFSGRDFDPERQTLRGRELTLALSASELVRLDSNRVPSDTVRLTASLFAGEFAWIAWNGRGASSRIAQPLSADDLATHAVIIRPGVVIRSSGMIDEPDAYYYSHHDSRRFPVFRIHYEDEERLYIDPVSGELIAAFDSDRRWSRWLFLALHRGDFAEWARRRPVWDIFMLVLMTGVTLGSITGVYLAYKRSARWIRGKF